jgi:hypothetical protein
VRVWASTPGDRWTTRAPGGQLLDCSVRSTDWPSCPHSHPQMWAGWSPGVAQGESGPGLPDVGDCGQLFWGWGPIGHPGPSEKFIRRGLRPARFLGVARPAPRAELSKITQSRPWSMRRSGQRGRWPRANHRAAADREPGRASRKFSLAGVGPAAGVGEKDVGVGQGRQDPGLPVQAGRGRFFGWSSAAAQVRTERWPGATQPRPATQPGAADPSRPAVPWPLAGRRTAS